jgi:hypothetical protein
LREAAGEPTACIGLDPAAHALGIRNAAQFAGRIEEHHDQLATGHAGLHDEALAGFGDVAGLLHADFPVRALHEPVGVVVLQHALADFELVFGRGGVLERSCWSSE